MAKGRPKKEGVERGSTGKITTAAYLAAKAAKKAEKKAEYDRNSADVVKWARMCAIIRELAFDARLSGVCGRMMLMERPARLSVKEFAASVRLYGILMDYDRLVLGLNRSIQAQNMNKAVGISCSIDAPSESVKAAAARWIEVQGVMATAGKDCPSATMALVREEQWEGRIPLAIAGLRALAQHWGISEVQESKVKRALDILFNGPSLHHLETKCSELQSALDDMREELRKERKKTARAAA